MQHSGFQYYLDFLGIDTGSYLLHYSFPFNESGSKIVNSSPYFPFFTGTLTNTGSFYNYSGSGNFSSGEKILISNSTGLFQNPNWSHIVIFEKTGNKGGVLFDSFISNRISSGYSLGITDNLQPYFQSYDNGGPLIRTSDLILGDKNAVCFSKNNNSISFYIYDFASQTSDSQQFSINGEFVFPSSSGAIGGSLNLNSGSYYSRNFSGLIDEYVIIAESLSAQSFQYLVSGLCSDYFISGGIVSGTSFNGIVGFTTGITGITGVTGYKNVVTGSGIDPFGTGNYIFYYQTSGVTGFLTTGLNIAAQTGLITVYTTGDLVNTINLNTGYLKSFGYSEISYLRSIDFNDISTFKTTKTFGEYNQLAGFDRVLGQMQVDKRYADTGVHIYLNGISQLNQGYSVTGDVYQSGVSLSGDYILDGFYVQTTGFIDAFDSMVYDNISGGKDSVIFSGGVSGSSYPLPLNREFYFLNGQLLISGLNWEASGNSWNLKTNQYSTSTGRLWAFDSLQILFQNQTGFFFNTNLNIRFPKLHSFVYLNGQRQIPNQNYIENSKFDLIKNSGLFNQNGNIIFNSDNNSGYFE